LTPQSLEKFVDHLCANHVNDRDDDRDDSDGVRMRNRVLVAKVDKSLDGMDPDK
jgi:hypothetical protein